jgi:hypothetical protein
MKLDTIFTPSKVTCVIFSPLQYNEKVNGASPSSLSESLFPTRSAKVGGNKITQFLRCHLNVRFDLCMTLAVCLTIADRLQTTIVLGG